MNSCLLVINYNGMSFLPSYLPGIAEQCKRNDIRLLVTDDLSKDDSIDFLKKGGYGYTVNTGTNHGFAANVNNGIRYALAVGGFDYFIIANNDILIPNGLFEVLEQVLTFIGETDKQFGLAGFDEVFAGNEQKALGFDFAGYDASVIRRVKEIRGFFFVISKSLIRDIGLLDESYFMYGEDNDYYLRTVKAGYSIYETFLPVIHFSEGSSVNGKQTSWYVYRNAFLYAQKNLGFKGTLQLLLSFLNQIYNPFYKPRNAGNLRVTRNGFFYNNYLLLKSIFWNLKYYLNSSGRNKR